MTGAFRLSVDPIACDGRGLCAELLPGLISLDDWGFPVLADRDVPAELTAEAAAVVRLCPRLALRLRRLSRHAREPCGALLPCRYGADPGGHGVVD